MYKFFRLSQFFKLIFTRFINVRYDKILRKLSEVLKAIKSIMPTYKKCKQRFENK